MKKITLTMMSMAMLTVSGMSFADTYVEGKDYQLAPQVGKVDVPGKIEVREFFWYGCPHCHKLEPYMQAWLRKLPSDVNFVRSPAAMNPMWEVAARGYYVSEALGIRRDTHLPLFAAFTTNWQQLSTQEGLAQFYSKYGVTPAKFNSLYNSFSINGKIQQSNNLAAFYRLQGVPAVVVNGKYIVQGEDQKMVDVVSYLVNKERTAMKKAS